MNEVKQGFWETFKGWFSDYQIFKEGTTYGIIHVPSRRVLGVEFTKKEAEKELLRRNLKSDK